MADRADTFQPPEHGAGGGESVYRGLGVSPGVAIGIVHRHDADRIHIPEQKIPKERVEAERTRFKKAVTAAERQLSKLQGKAHAMSGAVGEELGYLLDAYRQMLQGSRLVRGVDHSIAEDRICAENAVQREIDGIVQSFAGMKDDYLAARAEDIREIGRRLLHQLAGETYKPFALLPRNAIIMADELSPADTALLNPARVAGMATMLGGTASHTAIMARSLGLPAVVGVTGPLSKAAPGMPAVIDGGEGVVIINPTPATLALYREKRSRFLRMRRQLRSRSRLPAVTRDGTQISLQANLELPVEIDAVLAAGAAGVGLLRSEFLYMNRPDLPSEDEQYAVLKSLIERLDGRMLTVRTLDAGGDKIAPSLGGWVGANPALGLRAIRLSMRFPEILETQIAAILRAGVHGPLRILVPMICTPAEIRAVRAAMETAAKRLKRRRIPIASPLPPLGAMIEIPGAALLADVLAQNCDFFAIGTNDLIQYTLAIDRAEESVAHLYDPTHPAVLRLIRGTVEAAQRRHLPVSVCGEIAGDPRFTALLLGLGIRDLSMAANSLPVIRQRVRGLEMACAEEHARRVMDLSDAADIARLLDGFEPAEAG